MRESGVLVKPLHLSRKGMQAQAQCLRLMRETSEEERGTREGKSFRSLREKLRVIPAYAGMTNPSFCLLSFLVPLHSFLLQTLLPVLQAVRNARSEAGFTGLVSTR